jgi:hypothetical protein
LIALESCIEKEKSSMPDRSQQLVKLILKLLTLRHRFD